MNSRFKMIVALSFSAFMLLGTFGCKSVCEKAGQKMLGCISDFCGEEANAENMMCAAMEGNEDLAEEATGGECGDDDKVQAQTMLDQSCDEFLGGMGMTGGGDGDGE